MSIDERTVRKIFAGLEHGDGDAFFEHVADEVDWTVMGTHPLAGRYRTKSDFRAGTLAKLGKVLHGGAQLKVTRCLVSSDTAVVELESGATAHNACASTTIIAGSCASKAARWSRSAPISIRRWLPNCSARTRSDRSRPTRGIPQITQ